MEKVKFLNKLKKSIHNKDVAKKIDKIKAEYELKNKVAIMKASPKEVDVKIEDMQDLFAILKANINISQYAHWVTKGSSYHGDHLLYERLYNESTEELDGFAEKIVPLAGEETVNQTIISEKVNQVISEYSEATKNKETLPAVVLNMEKRVLQGLEEVYESLSKSDNLTMGFDDLLQAMHNLHESHTYLLGQRIKKDG